MKDEPNAPLEKNKFVWSYRYTLVLVLNAIYIFLFYFLMQSYS